MTIRAAGIADAAGIARVHVDAWRSTYRGIVPDSLLDGLSYEQRARTRREHLEKADPDCCSFVAVDGRAGIVGFSVAGPRRDGDAGYSGELYALYVLDEHQGKGLGKRLFLETVRWLSQRGHASLLTWVLERNPSRGFYPAMGGIEVGTKTIELGVPLVEVSYGWADLNRFVEKQ